MPPLPYKLCAIDLDDTLLGEDHSLSERNEQAIKRVVDLGVIVVIASGRMNEATLRFVKQIGLTTPTISYNGAMVRNASTGETLLHDRIASDAASEVLAYANGFHLQLNYYLDDHFYSAEYTQWAKLYHDRTQAPIEIKPDMYETLIGTSPTKLIIVDSPANTDALLPVFRDRFGTRLYVTKSNDEYLEMMPPEANKGHALSIVAERYGITADQTIAFGDSYNDIPMLKWAGLGIAVSNAKPDVLKIAGKITVSNADDGVAVALDEIFTKELS